MMNSAYTSTATTEILFESADEAYSTLKTRLVGDAAVAMTHSQVERLVEVEGRELLRALLQSHLDLRGMAEPITVVRGEDDIERTHRRTDTTRTLTTVLGEVTVSRSRYGARNAQSLHPVDADLNLPGDKYSLHVRRRVALNAARVSFDATVQAIDETTGALVPKRQVGQLVQRGAQDFEAYYEQTESAPCPQDTGPVLALSFDGKGIVMRPEGLRDATRQAAESTPRKLQTRLTKGEKPNRKRMAMVAAVFTVATWSRTAEDVIAGLRSVRGVDRPDRPRRPRPEHKRVWASVEREAEEVIDEAFAEAHSRDPDRKKTWVVLVDGLKSQLTRVHRVARRRGVEPVVILDFIHALEYLWKASSVFNEEGSPEAETWVLERLRRLLSGQARRVAGAIRRSATKRKLSKDQRKAADTCANYLTKYARYMHYDQYLAQGLPIASGVIEGTCRHLINDRLDITGACWGLDGAEAVLKLRALLGSGDFDEYWTFHEASEFERNHAVRYAAGKPPELARSGQSSHLRLVR